MDVVEENNVPDEPPLFEIFNPREYEDGIKREAELKKIE